MTGESLLKRALTVMPGGVSSPVRAFGAVEGDPPFLASGSGPRVTDAEGASYVDLVGSWGPLILGHAHPVVVEAVEKAVRAGMTFGATCEAEVDLAERILSAFPCGEKVRFVNSGTEAVMSAIRLARGATGRSGIVKFEGCYHGHSDALLVKGGSGLATFGTPSSSGVPKEVTGSTFVAPLDDEDSFDQIMDEKGDDIAVVVIEPLPANAGLLIQREEFLAHLRERCTEKGSLLLFDEVITGFRVARGGMTERTGVTPDLVTLGKVIGGGMPVGAYLGPSDLMDHVAPLGPVYQAGTLSGNPVAMAAGVATLDELDRPETYEDLEKAGSSLAAGWEQALTDHAVPGSVARLGSVLWLYLAEGPLPRAFHLIHDDAAQAYARLHRELLNQGTWMAPSAFEVAFLSLAHGQEEINAAIDSLSQALAAVNTQEGR